MIVEDVEEEALEVRRVVEEPEEMPDTNDDFFGHLDKVEDAPANNRATTRVALDEVPFKDSSESDGEEIPQIPSITNIIAPPIEQPAQEIVQPDV